MFKENLEALVSRLENLMTTKTLVGEPIVSGSITIIPIMTAAVGFGLGSGEGTDNKHGGKGAGGGAGIRLSPTALLIIQGEKVQVYSVAKKSALEQLAAMVPEALSKFHKKRDTCEESKDE